MAKGYIYIMTNPCLKDMVKIGYATNVEDRRKQLSTFPTIMRFLLPMRLPANWKTRNSTS